MLQAFHDGALDGASAFGRRLRWTQCAACGQGAGSRLCLECLGREGDVGSSCRRCALPTGTAVEACGRCIAEAPAFAATVAALPYARPWDGLLRRLKYHGAIDLAPAFAERLAERVLAARREYGLRPVDTVLAVPLSQTRLRERGFNQAWELARRIGRRLGHEASASTVLRLRDTPAQAQLGREARLRNLDGAFVVPPSVRDALAGRSVAVVDDVMTTGATAHAVARTLLEAGAASVQLWVVARTPAPVHTG
jgi:ComF family protein